MISEITSQEDVRALFTIFSDVWGADTLSELVESIQNTNCVLIKNKNNIVVGYVFYDLDPRENFIEITDFTISPIFRGQGYGKTLISTLCEKTDCVRLTVKEDNYAAKRVYEALGFKEIQRVQNYYGVCHDGIRMEKR